MKLYFEEKFEKGPEHPFWQKCLSDSIDTRRRYIRNLKKWHPTKLIEIDEELKLLAIEQKEYRLFCDDFDAYMRK